LEGLASEESMMAAVLKVIKEVEITNGIGRRIERNDGSVGIGEIYEIIGRSEMKINF
jgi:hypothetical protein